MAVQGTLFRANLYENSTPATLTRRAKQVSLASLPAMALLAGLLAGSEVQAALAISSATSQNITCSGNICSPTAKNAILNVTDLETLLASGSVTVTTTGSGVEATKLSVATGLSWSNTSTL